MHVKNGDIVKVISGKYQGQVGKIIKTISKKRQVIIENLNIKTKHIRPNQKEESGKIITFEAAIHSSNVMIYSTKNQVCSRYNIFIDETGQKCRQLKKTQEILK